MQDYFKRLANAYYYLKDNIADRIALLAIYIPIIRNEVDLFVYNWNSHSIRKQNNSLNAITGKPYMNYYHPRAPARDYGIPINDAALRTIKDNIGEWDTEPYLPNETLEWCRRAL